MSWMAALARRRAYFAISLAVLVLDQTTKLMADAFLRQRDPVVIVPDFFNLVYSRNPGGLFGYFGQLGDPWRTALLTLFPVLAVALIVTYLVRGESLDRLTRFALALVLGGAVGNLLDRLLRGEVVDFLDVYLSSGSLADWFVTHFGTAHWPTFNLADSSIVVGALLLLLSILRSRDEPSRARHRDAEARGR